MLIMDRSSAEYGTVSFFGGAFISSFTLLPLTHLTIHVCVPALLSSLNTTRLVSSNGAALVGIFQRYTKRVQRDRKT
jgi:hypothetical protein